MANVIRTPGILDQGYLFLGKFSQAGANFRNIPKIFSIGNFKNNPVFKSRKIMIGLVVLILVAGGFWMFKSKSQSSVSGEATYVAEGPRAQLNKRFEVPIKDAEGKEVGSALVVNVTYLERTGELIFQGRRLLSKGGKDFIVINLEVENATDNRLTVRPVDFFRLIDESGKSYAPDIQTDPVKVEPKSSKRTRTVYIVGDSQKILKFMIGEIKGGNSETVEVAI